MLREAGSYKKRPALSCLLPRNPKINTIEQYRTGYSTVNELEKKEEIGAISPAAK